MRRIDRNRMRQSSMNCRLSMKMAYNFTTARAHAIFHIVKLHEFTVRGKVVKNASWKVRRFICASLGTDKRARARAWLARSGNIKCDVINIPVASARISSEISHDMSTGESENDPFRGSVRDRARKCHIAESAGEQQRQQLEVWGPQTLVARGRRRCSSRERLRAALKEPPPPHLTSTSIRPTSIAVVSRARRYFSYPAVRAGVRYATHLRRLRDFLQQLPGIERPSPPVLFSVALKGAGSHIPFAPIFHKRY